jgi:hypothetical protein
MVLFFASELDYFTVRLQHVVSRLNLHGSVKNFWRGFQKVSRFFFQSLMSKNVIATLCFLSGVLEPERE